ncbi:MAG: M20/M25/M40 family metallo-hydrolase, partial [Candidatus Krumholzibacteriia bacterium]
MSQPSPATQASSPWPDAAVVAAMRALESDPGVRRALELLGQRGEEITDLQVRFARIPSPDHRAAERADLLKRLLGETGLRDVRTDATGNVIAVLPGGTAGLPAVILSAHVDTVFPNLEHIEIERDGSILRGPGIADDAAGLAAVVHLVRALRDASVPLRRDVVVVGTVGEEGEGDLRGVKHLFESEYVPARVLAFLTLDLGGHQHVVNGGLGSRRLRVTARGPGGHSWGDFGRPNPIHTLSRAVGFFLDAIPPGDARSTYNIGTIQGGSSVNAIPESACMHVDLRSESPAALEELEQAFRDALDQAVERERQWSRERAEELHVVVEVIGDRPVGETPADSDLVR